MLHFSDMCQLHRYSGSPRLPTPNIMFTWHTISLKPVCFQVNTHMVMVQVAILTVWKLSHTNNMETAVSELQTSDIRPFIIYGVPYYLKWVPKNYY